jgi:hypothetical protein
MSRQALWPPFRHLASVSVALRLVAAVVLILVVAASYYELQTSRNAIIADTQRQMARLDMVFAEQTGRAIEAVDLLVLGAPEASQVQPVPNERIGDVWQRRIRGVQQLAAILVVDATGRPTVSTDADRSYTPPEMVEALLARYRADPQAGLLIGLPFRVADNK